MGVMGRPSSYTDAIGDTICAKLASGSSLTRICKGDDMPGLETVYRWLRERDDFRDRYASAREDQADTLADEIVEIADETAFDTKEGPNGKLTADSEWIARSRLRVDARKWVAAKLKPKKYGDKTLVGSDPDNPLPTSVAVVFRDPPKPD